MPKLAPLKHQGNESLFMAVEMSLISTLAGMPLHIHAEGLRGTGKTTVMRWAKGMVPNITQIKNCAYHCDPERPHCPIHQGTGHPGMEFVESIPMPFVEIGHGAKLGTILGSVNLEKLTDPRKPEASLLPGAIPMANRGIVFIDEVNRLAETAPEITDVLLSVMGTKPGRIKIEEVGLPTCEIEVTASVWAASNPDEDPGPLEDIRRQLADRFDLVIPVQRPQDPAIVERLLFRETEPDSPKEDLLRNIASKAESFANVLVPRPILRYMAQLYVHRNVESLRAIEALELSARLCATIKGKSEVTFDEILSVIPLVLRHRVEPLTLSEIMKDLELRRAAGTHPKAQPESPEPGDKNPNVQEKPPQVVNAPDSGLSQVGSESIPRDVDPHDQAPSSGTSKSGVSGNSSAADPVDSATQGWLQNALQRYRQSLRKLSGQSKNSKAAYPGGRSAPQQYVPVPNPRDIPPVSPSERARRLSALSWDELVNPPEWKDTSP